MIYDHDLTLARGYSEDVLSRLKKDGLPPLPIFYELWYAYYSNAHPELKRIIDARTNGGKILSASDCQMLHDEYLSERKHQEVFHKASDQINATLHDVSGLMHNVKDVASQYSQTLEGATQNILSVKTPKEMEAVLKSIVADTNLMMKNNKELEKQLDKSAYVMDELKRDLERVRREASTDGLTGISNRKHFDTHLEKLTVECAANRKTFTLLMIDIDHFKSFNDNYGHQVGDQVLRLVSRTLTDGIKGKDLASRYGGEEFTILLPETGLNHGIIVAESLRKALAGKEVINKSTGDHLGRITMSVGVAEFHAGETTEGLIGRADAALYIAKHNGRNQVAAAPTPQDKLFGKQG